MNNKIITKIENATIEDAQKLYEATEKTMWCIEYLEAFSLDRVMFYVDRLEQRFEELLLA
jgi:hypothetical protein